MSVENTHRIVLYTMSPTGIPFFNAVSVSNFQFPIVLVPINLCHHFLLSILMHLDTEIDEGKEAEAAYIRIDRTAEGESIVNAMGKNRNKQDAGSCLG